MVMHCRCWKGLGGYDRDPEAELPNESVGTEPQVPTNAKRTVGVTVNLIYKVLLEDANFGLKMFC